MTTEHVAIKVLDRTPGQTRAEYDRLMQVKEKLLRDRILTASDPDAHWLISECERLGYEIWQLANHAEPDKG